MPKPTKSKTKSKKYTKPSKISTGMKKTINRMIKKDVEVKRTEIASQGNSIYHVINDARMFNLAPVISQGVGQGNRLGNEIILKRATLSINVYMNPLSLESTSPHYIDIYILKYKKYNFLNPTSADCARLLQLGNSATLYDGDTFDGMRDINSDVWSLKKHYRYTMMNTATVANYTGYSNFNATKQFKVDITKYFKKKQLYDDSTSNFVINDNLYLCIGDTSYNQVSVPADTTNGSMDFLVTWEYTDE